MERGDVEIWVNVELPLDPDDEKSMIRPKDVTLGRLGSVGWWPTYVPHG